MKIHPLWPDQLFEAWVIYILDENRAVLVLAERIMTRGKDTFRVNCHHLLVDAFALTSSKNPIVRQETTWWAVPAKLFKSRTI